jgi:hypothetical protein
MHIFSRLLPVAGSAFSLQTSLSFLLCLETAVLGDLTLHDMLAVLAAVFVPQANEKWYDLGGSLGFLSTTFVSLYYPTLKARYWQGTNVPFPPLSSFAPRQILLTAALTVWTVRLGSFLVQVISTYPSCSVRCGSYLADHFLCSAPSRSEETHVSTKSSISLGPF